MWSLPAELFVNAHTVEELLREASREVRSIMWDVTALDGPGLAAAWPAFATQARAALEAVPLPDPATRLLIHRAAGPRPRPNRWGPPVQAGPDRHLLRAGQALAAVAVLLRRYATPAPSAEAGRDADLVRRRIAECLFVGCHATALGLLEHGARLRPALPGIAFERPEQRLAVAGANQAQSRRLASDLATFEAHAGHYLARRLWGEPLKAAPQVVDLDRLSRAVAQWEVTAMRVLHAQPPSVRDLTGIAQTEQALLVHAIVMLNAAARACVIDPGVFDRQIRLRLQDVQAAWGDVAANWPAQMSTPASPSMAGVRASARLHAALDEITLNGNGWATPAQISTRVHLTELAGQLRDAAMASVNRAERFAELPAELADAGQLHAPARLLAAMPVGPSRRGRDLDAAVRTADVANRRIVLVRPDQTAGATAAACELGRQLTSLTAALETLPLGRTSRAVPEPASSAREAARGAGPAGPAVATIGLAPRATVGR
jgi:hypothetical protein